MAKKIPKDKELLNSNNSIIVELRNDRWIYNPVVYSQLRGDFTLMQQRILVGIVERLQQRIIDSIEEQHKSGKWIDIFDSAELQGDGNIEITIPTEDLGILPSNYPQLEQAATNLAKIQMKMPVYDSNGKLKATKLINIFGIVEMPVYSREVNGESVAGKRKGYLRVVMMKEAVRDIFSMQRGFIRHLSQIALIATKKRTPRLYIYLIRYKKSGRKQVPYNDLLEYLGLTDDFYFETNGGTIDKNGNVVNPFSEWNRVKSQVLVPTQKEMKQLADEGKIDFFFEFEPVYPQGKNRGTPLAIDFSIIMSTLGEMRETHDKRRNMIYQFVDRYIQWCPDLSQRDLLLLVDDLSEKQLQEFITYAYKDVRKLVERRAPDEVAPYVLTCLRRWKQQAQQQDLFSQAMAREEEEKRRRREEQEKRDALIPGNLAEQYQQLYERCSPEYREWLSKATYLGTKMGYPVIDFETADDCQAFNEFENKNKKLADEFTALRKEVFGPTAYRFLKRGFKKR